MSSEDLSIGMTPWPTRVRLLCVSVSPTRTRLLWDSVLVHAWNTAIVISASHNGLFHRQQYLVRLCVKETLLLGRQVSSLQVQVMRGLVISFTPPSPVKGGLQHPCLPLRRPQAKPKDPEIPGRTQAFSGFVQASHGTLVAMMTGRVRAVNGVR